MFLVTLNKSPLIQEEHPVLKTLPSPRLNLLFFGETLGGGGGVVHWPATSASHWLQDAWSWLCPNLQKPGTRTDLLFLPKQPETKFFPSEWIGKLHETYKVFKTYCWNSNCLYNPGLIKQKLQHKAGQPCVVIFVRIAQDRGWTFDFFKSLNCRTLDDSATTPP